MRKKHKRIIFIGRVIMVLTTLALFMLFIIAWSQGSNGELLAEITGIQIPESLKNWQKTLGFFIFILPLFAMTYGFYWINKFFIRYQSTESVTKTLTKTIKHFGLSQIYFWFSLMIAEFMLPIILYFYINSLSDNIEIPIPISPDNMILLSGIVMIILSKLLYKASEVQEEIQEFV